MDDSAIHKNECNSKDVTGEASDLKKSEATVHLALLFLTLMLSSRVLVFQLKAAGEVLISVDPYTQVNPEDEFNITFYVGNMLPESKVVAFEVQLDWDPSLITGVKISEVLYHLITPESEWDNIWVLANRINNTAGNAYLAYLFQDIDRAVTNGYAPITGSNTLAILTLRALNKTGTTSLNFTVAKAGGFYYDKWQLCVPTQVPVNATGGSVAISNRLPTIYIRANGGIDPVSAPISTLDNVTYTLTGNVASEADGIFIERDNITLDGGGFTLEGTEIQNSRGISLVTITNATITRMKIVSFWEGIYLSGGWQNHIIRNRIADNDVGIDIYSGRHIIAENEFVHNDLLCALGRSNLIYHNNFLNASAHVAEAYPGNYDQIWDDGYPSGGNYWSDYNGTDAHSGPNQNETGSDGIGDTPCGILYYENIDHYPLKKPYGGPHDVGITCLDASKKVLAGGYSLNASVKITNYGVEPAVLNTMIYANSTFAGGLPNITIPSRNSTTETCMWNSTGFDYGIYSITAHVSTVPGESDTEDNSCSDWVILTLPGDLDGDFVVSSSDAGRLTAGFELWSGHPDWNPNLDINCDNIVDIYDSILLANYYNGHYP